MDSQEPHLRSLLGFIGIRGVTFVRAEKLAFGPEIREQAINSTRAQLGHVLQRQSLQVA
jgi:FMN-dependent NADH-azoreductase